MNHFVGGCHCGNITVEFDTHLALDELPLRADQCSFCRKHSARTTTDPKGRLRIIVRDSRLLLRYRFGLNTADFLACGRCGIYVAAVLTADGWSYATLNVNTLDHAEGLTQEARAVSYDFENSLQRRERRIENWTPAVVEEC